MKYHLIRYDVVAKTIHRINVSMTKQIVAILTKALGRDKFKKLKMMLGIIKTPSN